ncbi:MAG: VanZ family protein [bacterium]|nr:VanZ family protein [bacterium]
MTPLDQTIRGVMEFTWPMVIICVLILSSIRITAIIRNHEKFILYEELLKLLFMIYILCLFQIVTFEDPTFWIGEKNFNLIPLKEISRYELGSRLFFKNVIGNLIMFIPYGSFASFFTKNDNKYLSLILVSFASLTIEVTQLSIGRIFDIDDVLLNIAGGMIGYVIYRALTKVTNFLPNKSLKNKLLNVLTIVLIGIFIGYVWMVMI